MDPRVFGTFVEHMGRSVHTGIFEPGHPTEDGSGFRGDVADLVRQLGPTVVRHPGGNFVSGYRWEDGVGPVGERPVRLDTAWKEIETNEVGPGEFTQWLPFRRDGADHGGQPGDARRTGSDGPARVLQPSRRYGALGPATQARVRRPVRDPHLVPRQRAGRALAARRQDRAGVRPARRRDRAGHAHGRPPDRAGRLRELEQPDADLRRMGGDRPRALLRARRLHLAALLLRPAAPGAVDVPGQLARPR